MSFYYTREYGDEGQILVGDGDPPGERLSGILSRGPLSVRLALEVIAYLADILTIAEEDGEVHGDLKPGYVHIDQTGSVHLSGYGEDRRGGRAPEGRPLGVSTDIYGVGLILVSALTTESIGAIPRDPDAHDDLIIDKLKQVDWQELADRSWQEQVIHFLCSMLNHAPQDRPEALDVANVLGHVAGQLRGEGLQEWASRELGVVADESERLSDDTDEDLSGAHRIGVAAGQSPDPRTYRQAASTKGESTAFWTREKIAEMLRESELEDERSNYEPPVEEPPEPDLVQRLPPEIPELPDATIGAGSNTLDALEEARDQHRARWESAGEEEPLSDGLQSSSPPLETPSPAESLQREVTPAEADPQPPHVSAPPPPPPAPAPAPAPTPAAAPTPPPPPPAPEVVPVAAYGSPDPSLERPPPPPVATAGQPSVAPTKVKSSGGPQLLIALFFGFFVVVLIGFGVGFLLPDLLDDRKTSKRSRDDDSESTEEAGEESGDETAGIPPDTGIEAEGTGEGESGGEEEGSTSGGSTRSTTSGGSSGSSGGSDGGTGGSDAGSGSGEDDPEFGTATVHLSFPGPTAVAYFCGSVSGEFESSVVFELDKHLHSYSTAVTTCLVQYGLKFKERLKGQYRGSFTVRGLGEKRYSCAMSGQNITCTGG